MNRPRLLLFFILATVSLPLLSQDRFRLVPGIRPGGGEIKWSAARQELEKDEYAILEGNVKMEYQDIKVQADRVTYNQKTKDVVAEGNVIIDQGPTRVTANRAIYNLESKTGTFFEATGTMDPQMYFSGDRIEKVDQDTYRLVNGVVTSCDLDRPAWSFHIGHADITVNDYAFMRNVSFRTRGVPLLWTPRLIWPTKSDRSQGLLIPRLQFSDVFGTRLELGYFIPFGDSADATLTADVNEEGYYGAGVNVRYLPSRNVNLGDLFAYGVRDVRPVDPATPREGAKYQWRYRYQHSQENLPGGFRAVVDIEDFSNLDFFREYDRDPRLHTLSQVYSSAYLTKNRPKYSLNILADRREFLLSNQPVQRFEQLPSLQLRVYPQRLGRTPLYFALESSASQLLTNAIGSTTLPEDISYHRGDVFPTISMQLRTPAWFSIRPQISLRSTYYSTSLERDPVTARPRVIEEPVDRFYAQGQVEVVGPSLSRIFNRSAAGFSRFKHVVEPRFRYLYTTEVADQEKLIRFDTVDSPFLPLVRDSVEYSLTQRIIGKESKEGGSAREVMSISLRQTAALSKKFESATSGGTFGEEHKFTPLVATLRVNPYQSITIDANATIGNVSRQLDQASFSANLIGTGSHADKYLSFTWFASFEDPVTRRIGSSQFRINVGSALLHDRIRGDVHLNYDATESEFLEQRYILGLTGSCYGIAVGARRFRLFGAEGEEERWSADFMLTLKNVGTIGSLK